MASLANITVKKNDGTTDITYTGIAPSAGDRSPAIWRSQTIGTAAAHRPELRMTSRSNGTGGARRVEGTYTYPTLVTDSGGKIQVADKVIVSFSAVIPQGMPDTDVNEAVSQSCHLMATTLVKDSIKSGFAPT